MKKNAIIDIINNDIADIQLLISTFRNAENIPEAFIKMLEQKLAALGQEIELLKLWQTPATETEQAFATQKPEKEITIEPVKSESKAVATQPENAADLFPEKKNAFAEVQKPQPEPQKTQPAPQKPAEKKPEAAAKPKAHTPSAADIKAFGTPVSAVAKAFSINDRILYQKELYGGDHERFAAELAAVDKMQSFDEAHNYLCVSHSDWDEQNEIVAEYFRTIHRRFI